MPNLKVEFFDTTNPNEQPLKTFLVPERPANPVEIDKIYFNLNDYKIADKVARVRVTPGDKYSIGDHILLWNENNLDSEVISIDPDIKSDVNLNNVYNNGHFADRAALMEVVISSKNQKDSFVKDKYKFRVSLYDQVQQDAPSLILYDWQFTAGFTTRISIGIASDPFFYDETRSMALMKWFKFSRRTAFLKYEALDHVYSLELTDGIKILSLDTGEYNLNNIRYDDDSSWADKVGALTTLLESTPVDPNSFQLIDVRPHFKNFWEQLGDL